MKKPLPPPTGLPDPAEPTELLPRVRKHPAALTGSAFWALLIFGLTTAGTIWTRPLLPDYNGPLTVVACAVALLTLLSFLYAHQRWANHSFQVDQHGVHIQEGVLIRREHPLYWVDIKGCESRRPPLQALCGCGQILLEINEPKPGLRTAPPALAGRDGIWVLLDFVPHHQAIFQSINRKVAEQMGRVTRISGV